MELRSIGLLYPGPLPLTTVPKCFTARAPITPLKLPCNILWMSHASMLSQHPR